MTPNGVTGPERVKKSTQRRSQSRYAAKEKCLKKLAERRHVVELLVQPRTNDDPDTAWFLVHCRHSWIRLSLNMQYISSQKAEETFEALSKRTPLDLIDCHVKRPCKFLERRYTKY